MLPRYYLLLFVIFQSLDLCFLVFFSCLIFVLYFCFLFCVFVLFCLSFLLLCCLFPIFVQVHRLLQPGGKPITVNKYHHHHHHDRRSQWPRGLRRGSTAARLLWLRVRIPPGYGRLSRMIVVCCQVKVSATGRSFVQRSPTECGVSERGNDVA